MRIDYSATLLCLGVLASTIAMDAFAGGARITEQKTLIVAHRGASGAAPENTLPAFRLAWEEGADAVEGDFYLTKDNKIVCIHDRDTERTAGVKLEISETTLAELQQLDAGSWKDEKYSGTKIPTIAEVFETVPPGKKIYIEVKIGPEIIPELLREIRKSGLADDQVVVIAFNPEVIREIKKAAPQFKANWLRSVKKEEGEWTHPLDEDLKTLEKIDADGLSSNNQVDQAYVQAVIAAGFDHHVWTVNDLETAKRFKKWGTKSITTNLPGLITAVND